jgi:hypothetical protein
MCMPGWRPRNLDSYLVEDSYEEEIDKDHVRTGQIRRVIAYGIAAMLVGNKVELLNKIVDEARG